MLALVLRLNWFLQRSEIFPVEWPDEFSYYISTAVNAFEGRGFFPDYNRTTGEIFVPPPLQSAFILGFFLLCDQVVNPFWIKLVQVFLVSVLGSGLFFYLGQKLFSTQAGLWSALIAAVFPPFVFWPAFLLTESNYFLALLILLVVILKWNVEKSIKQALLIGVVLGFMNLLRANGFYLGIFLAGFVVIAGKNFQRKWLHALVLITVPFLVMTPWLFRNLKTYGDPIWVSSHGGILFHFANRINYDPIAYPYWEHMWAVEKPGPLLPHIENQFRDLSTVIPPPSNNPGDLTKMMAEGKGGKNHPLNATHYRYSQAYLKVAKNYILEHPFHFLKNYCLKMFNQFYLVQDITKVSVPFLSSKRAFFLLDRCILIFGFVGLFLSILFTRRRENTVIFWVFLYFSLFGALTHMTADGRLNLFLKLFLVLFSGVTVTFLTEAAYRKIKNLFPL